MKPAEAVRIALCIAAAACLDTESTAEAASFQTRYRDIPRVDVHTHVAGDLKGITNYHELRAELRRSSGADLAMWVNLGDGNGPITNLSTVMDAGQGRILCCISSFSPHLGPAYSPGELQSWMEKGFVGYKIWYGPPQRRLKQGEKGFPYVDDPAHEPTFAELERKGILVASIHIADPNGPWGARTRWLADPVEFWRQITAWRHVLERHPNLKVVAAHGNWLVCQDAQLDYLRNMLATFPGLNVDLAATFQYFPLVNRENLCSFMIEWADRIVYGTDIGRWANPKETSGYAARYARTFEILETTNTVQGGFFGNSPVQGLELPREVLEKIYFRNASRLYPHMREAMAALGHDPT